MATAGHGEGTRGTQMRMGERGEKKKRNKEREEKLTGDERVRRRQWSDGARRGCVRVVEEAGEGERER